MIEKEIEIEVDFMCAAVCHTCLLQAVFSVADTCNIKNVYIFSSSVSLLAFSLPSLLLTFHLLAVWSHFH